MSFRVARIESGVVANVELAGQDWLDAHAGDAGVVLDDPIHPASIGLGYDPVTGFEQPAPVVEP